MADISKCTGEGCPQKKKCLRYWVTPGRWQSYFAVPPGNGDTCRYFVYEEPPEDPYTLDDLPA